MTAPKLGAGDLKRRITIDGIGTVWSKPEALQRNYVVVSAHGEQNITYKFTIRYRRGIESATKLTYNEMELVIINPIDPDDTRTWLELYCADELRLPQPHMLQTAEIYPVVYGTFGLDYGQPVTVSCRIEHSQKRDAAGSDSEIIAAQSPGFFPAGTEIAPDYRVVCDGITYTVVEVKPVLEVTTISHIEVVLR